MILRIIRQDLVCRFFTNSSTLNDSSNDNDPIKNPNPLFPFELNFDNLIDGFNYFKTLAGIAGVYMLINKNNTDRFYIGSSVDLSRRIKEYKDLVDGVSKPISSSQKEIAQTNANDWRLIIIKTTLPQLALIYEQLAIILLKPTINATTKVIPRIFNQWNNLIEAINLITIFRDSFKPNSFGYARFSYFLIVFKSALDFRQNPNYNELINQHSSTRYSNYSTLIWCYDLTKANAIAVPLIFSSINKTLKSLSISHSTLIESLQLKYLVNNSLALSLSPLTLDELATFKIKDKANHLMRKLIQLYNEELELIHEFKSMREMARFFGVNFKLIAAATKIGQFRNYHLIVKPYSFNKPVYVYDAVTHNLIIKLNSINAAMKYSHCSFYTLIKLIETGSVHNGKIFSYNATYSA